MRWIVFCILGAACVFAFPFVSAAIQDDAMVLYYSFDAGKGKLQCAETYKNLLKLAKI